VYGTFGSSGGKVAAGTASGATVKLLIPDVTVLQVNLNASSSLGANGVNSQSNVLLKVNANEAGAVAFAANNGGVWLALRGANATGPSVAQGTATLNSLLLGSNAQQSGGK
jgi:Flp pilus assembly protein CpaB